MIIEIEISLIGVTNPSKIVIIEVTEPFKTVIIGVTNPSKIVIIGQGVDYSTPCFIKQENKMQDWKIINADYLDFLRDNYEKRIPKTDYGKNKLKPFFGILMTADGLSYVTQISSVKPRHNNLKENIDFYKIYIRGKFVAVVNLNYMFPVPDSEIVTLKYKNIDDYVTFPDDTKRSQYIKFLQQEMKVIRTLPLEKSAQQIYNLKKQEPNNAISQRCFDFCNLENGANSWIKNHLNE